MTSEPHLGRLPVSYGVDVGDSARPSEWAKVSEKTLVGFVSFVAPDSVVVIGAGEAIAVLAAQKTMENEGAERRRANKMAEAKSAPLMRFI
jgi:hypothetical protein